MKHKLSVLTTGFALFAMFFGSGNLVFPLLVGQQSHGHFTLASLGILLTGVLVPLAGVLGMVLFRGSTRDFFGVMGQPAVFWFSLIALSLMGPFGVLARCITVAFGSFQLLFPDASLIVFSLVACAVLFWTTINKSRVVPMLGSILTPVLLLSLVLIALFGLWFKPLPPEDARHAWLAFQEGFFQGYQTMDLLAAFFFSTVVIRHLEKKAKDTEPRKLTKMFLHSALVGTTLLSVVYCALVLLGATYANELVDVPPQQMLAVVAQQAMGAWSAPIVCTFVVLACLTTGIVLATLFAEFLKHEISKNKLSDAAAMCITLAIAFVISTLDFAGIARFLTPILQALYPALIVLTAINISSKLFGVHSPRWPVVLTLAATLWYI